MHSRKVPTIGSGETKLVIPLSGRTGNMTYFAPDVVTIYHNVCMCVRFQTRQMI